MFLLMFIITFHELGHLLFASIINISASKIIIYAFGGITKYNIPINISINKELFILIGGPIFQIILLLIIKKLNLYINENTYNEFIYLNKILFSFNLLPILNLDGGKLINLILNKIFSYKTSFNISLIISIISLPITFYIFNKYLAITIIIFIIKELIIEVKNKDYGFNKLLTERYINNYKFKKRTLIKNINKVKRDKNFDIYYNGNLFNEREYLNLYFSRKNRCFNWH